MKYTGKIQSYYPDRKFGFILVLDGSSWFFHLSNCPFGLPVLGEFVEFEFADPVKLGQRKMAVNVTPIPAIPSKVLVFDDVLAGSTAASTEVSK
jgi:cold shock CspA family protein